MLTSIRARVICAFVALVVFSVVVSTAANYLIARNSMWDATDSSLSTSLNDHAAYRINQLRLAMLMPGVLPVLGD